MKMRPYTESIKKRITKDAEAIPVLMYHWFYDLKAGRKPDDPGGNWISAQMFEQQMQYLHDNDYYYASWIELEDWIDYKIDLPRKTIVLTDDDAYITFFTIALPIFRKYGIPFTSFVPTSLADDILPRVHEYEDEPYINFESHSDEFHKYSRICYKKSTEELYEDTRKSVEYLGKHEVFAYPFGQYCDAYIEALKLNGFKLAFTTVNTKVRRGMAPYILPRVRISKDMTIDDFIQAIQ